MNLNISTEIWNKALEYPNLRGYATGGGCDFITRSLPNDNELVLADAYDECPTRLNQTAKVIHYVSTNDELWNKCVNEYHFDTVEQAMDFMTNNNLTEKILGTFISQHEGK